MDSPTSSLNVTFALGIIVFVYAQWIGIRGLGPVGYVDHLLGSPRDLTGWLLAPLMLPIHVLGELAKPISLSCRLFGNIFGEDNVIEQLMGLGGWIPFQIPMLLLALFTSFLQAFIFTTLSTIYIASKVVHEGGHGDEHGHDEGHHDEKHAAHGAHHH
jgi:F-type H+-transporting ATPase subunit a